MSAVLTEPDKPVVVNRCKIDEVFGGPFIELLTLAPKNPVVRGLILSQTRKLPGPECETFEQIKAWVETTCDKRLRPPNAIRGPSGDGIVIRVEFSETENGRAHYSVSRSGSDDFALDENELLDMVREAIEAGGGVDAVVERIAQEIDDDAWNRCNPNLDNYGDYDYEDHDSGDSSDAEVEFSRTQVRDRLLRFLRDRHPDLLEDLA
jgi:hypothetical protein